MRRRLLAAAAGVTLGLALVEPAMAGESINSGAWDGSELDPGSTTETSVGLVSLSGSFTRGDPRPIQVEVRAAPTAGSPGCPVNPAPPSDEGPSQPQPHEFDATLDVPCNGRYLVEAVARTTRNSAVLPADSAILDRTVDVAVPPAEVQGVTATEGDARAVTVSWTALAPRPADLAGYTIERQASDGTVESFTMGDATSYVDSPAPAAGGDTTYLVFARRPGPTGDVWSPSAQSATVAVSPAPVPPTDPTDPTDPGTPGGPTGPGNPSAGGGTGSGTGGSTVNGGAGRPSPSIRVPRVGTPSRNFFPPLLSPPSPEDTGFSEELPFEEREPGEEDAVLPDDALASGPLDAAPGRGLVIPLATGLVLAVWALHLRFLARAARPEYLEESDLPDLVQW